MSPAVQLDFNSHGSILPRTDIPVVGNGGFDECVQIGAATYGKASTWFATRR
jgi:hypothetical protein